MNCFVPLMTQSEPSRTAPRLDRSRIGAGARLGEREALAALAADRREEEALPLLALAGEQDVGGPRDARVERPARAGQLHLGHRGGHVVEAAATELRGHVQRVQACVDRLVLEGARELGGHVPQSFDLLLVRTQLSLDEVTHGLGDELLLLGEREVDRRPRNAG